MSKTLIATRQLALSEDADYVAQHAADTLADTNVDISSPGATVAGLAMTAGQTVMLVGQTDGSENGKYVWHTDSSPMTRSIDLDHEEQFIIGSRFYVRSGTNSGQTWYLVGLSDDPFVLDDDEPVFLLADGLATYRRYNVASGEAADGEEDTFTFGPEWGSTATNVVVRVNGVTQEIGGGNDYTIDGTPAVVFNSPPPPGSKVRVDFDIPIS